jgi:hypothetical protein
MTENTNDSHLPGPQLQTADKRFGGWGGGGCCLRLRVKRCRQQVFLQHADNYLYLQTAIYHSSVIRVAKELARFWLQFLAIYYI